MSRYAGHVELVAAIHRNEDVEMLTTLHAAAPTLHAFPVSGDMLAIQKGGSDMQKRKRRQLAQHQRRGEIS